MSGFDDFLLPLRRIGVREWEIFPASEEDILVLERSAGAPVPKSYRQFLTLAGRGAGRFMCGTSFYFPRLPSIKLEAVELLVECGKSPKILDSAYVIYMHQGYEMCFTIPDGTDDPPVHMFRDDWADPQKQWNGFMDFFLYFIELYETQWTGP